MLSEKKGSSPFSLTPVMLLAINMNRRMWLLCREICLAFLLCQQTKSLGSTGLVVLPPSLATVLDLVCFNQNFVDHENYRLP